MKHIIQAIIDKITRFGEALFFLLSIFFKTPWFSGSRCFVVFSEFPVCLVSLVRNGKNKIRFVLKGYDESSIECA